MCVSVDRFLIRVLAEPPADTVSEQVIPETRKESWFGSISRKRKRNDTAKPVLGIPVTEEPVNTVLEESTPPLRTESPTANDAPQLAPPPTSDAPTEPPDEIPLDNVPPSLPPTSPPRPLPQNVQGVLSKPAHLGVLSPTISISSIDDFVPQPKSLPVLSIPTPPQNPIPISVGGVGDVTTTALAGPTTSRFTLRLPLLGRPKIPLDQAVAVAQAEDIRNTALAIPVDVDSTTPSSTSVTEEAQRPGVAAVPSNTSA